MPLFRSSPPWLARQQRHLSYLAEFTRSIVYVPGKENVVPDALPRPDPATIIPKKSALFPATGRMSEKSALFPATGRMSEKSALFQTTGRVSEKSALFQTTGRVSEKSALFQITGNVSEKLPCFKLRAECQRNLPCSNYGQRVREVCLVSNQGQSVREICLVSIYRQSYRTCLGSNSRMSCSKWTNYSRVWCDKFIQILSYLLICSRNENQPISFSDKHFMWYFN